MAITNFLSFTFFLVDSQVCKALGSSWRRTLNSILSLTVYLEMNTFLFDLMEGGKILLLDIIQRRDMKNKSWRLTFRLFKTSFSYVSTVSTPLLLVLKMSKVVIINCWHVSTDLFYKMQHCSLLMFLNIQTF